MKGRLIKRFKSPNSFIVVAKFAKGEKVLFCNLQISTFHTNCVFKIKMVCDNFVKGEPFIKQSKCNRFVSKLSQSKPALSSKATCCVTMVATKFTQWICDAFNCAQPRLHMSWSSFLSINLSVEYMACPHYKIPRTLVLTRFRVGSSRHASNSPQSSVTTH